MLKKIYQELVVIRKELQSIKSAMEPRTIDIKEATIELITESLEKAADSVFHTLGE